jgi:hypothetical protein
VPNTGDAAKWKTVFCPVSRAIGVHDLYFLFTGGDALKFDCWQFQ